MFPKRFTAAATAVLSLCLLAASASAAPHKKTNRKKAAPVAAASAAAAAVAYASRDDAMQLANDIAVRRDLPADWVRAQLSEARNLPVVTRLMTPAGKTFVKNWTVYRSRFIDPVRIRAGASFWQANRQALERAEQQFGVPAEIIVGIIGVETIYGRNMGNFRVMDALATLTLDFPQSHPRAQARTDYFRGELEQVLVTANRTGSDPFALRGSYAGAMGLGQFMPTSWDKYAVDFDGDADELRRQQVQEFRAHGQAQLQHVEQQAARQLQPFVDGKAAIAVRVVDIALPAHRGARLFKVHAHDDQQIILERIGLTF